jgi:phosphoribosylpyrophosphate synthetase
MFACHGIFSKNALNNIEKSKFTKVIVTNTLDQSRHQSKIKELNLENRMEVIDVSWMCAEAIRGCNYGQSLQALYDKTEKINTK